MVWNTSFNGEGTLKDAFPNFYPERLLRYPHFEVQQNYVEMTCKSTKVVPVILARIERGFFLASDGAWHIYRRHYFSVSISYELNPCISDAPLYLGNNNNPVEVQSLAVCVSAVADCYAGDPRTLFQYTVQREKGPQVPPSPVIIAPTPPDQSSYKQIARNHLSFSEPPPITQASSEYHHTFERLQFKRGTIKNSSEIHLRRFNHLVAELWAKVQRPEETEAHWVKVAARFSCPLIVRGSILADYRDI